MRNKKLISGILAGAMTVAMSYTAAIADNTYTAGSIDFDADSPYVMKEEPDYISFEEYLNKCGEENVIKGFKQAEANNKAELLKISGETEASAIAEASVDLDSDEPNELFNSLSDGEFLGLKVLGVSDISPDDMRLTVQLERDSEPVDTDAIESDIEPSVSLASSDVSEVYDSLDDFDLYYMSNCVPDGTELSEKYEEDHGSYMYKVSIGYTHNYLCSTVIDFSGAKLKRGTQDTNMYTYLAAINGHGVQEFGFMANPSDSSRNAGMYAYHTDLTQTSNLYVESYPKVYGTCSNNILTFGTVNPITVSLGVGTEEDKNDPLNGNIQMYMYMNEEIPNFV